MDARVGKADTKLSSTHQRAVARISNEFIIKAAVNIAQFTNGDLTTALVFLSIKNENIRHIEHNPQNVRNYWSADSLVPDSERAPVTIFVVAKALGLTYETARRHVNRLLAEGYCARTDRGFIVPMAVLTRPEIVRMNARNLDLFNDLLHNAVDDGLIQVEGEPS